MTFQQRSKAAIGLATCIFGLLLVPYIYIAIGALFSFPSAFSAVMIPLLLMSSGFLFWHFLAKPTKAASGTLFLAIEIFSWLAIGFFLFFVSNFTLLTSFERVGLFCTFFLLACFICLLFVLARKTSLEQRLEAMPSRILNVVLVLVLAFAVSMTIAYLVYPAKFI